MDEGIRKVSHINERGREVSQYTMAMDIGIVVSQ